MPLNEEIKNIIVKLSNSFISCIEITTWKYNFHQDKSYQKEGLYVTLEEKKEKFKELLSQLSREELQILSQAMAAEREQLNSEQDDESVIGEIERIVRGVVQ